MELILKSDNKQSIAKILAFAKKLNVSIEQREVDGNQLERELLKNRILKFKTKGTNPFGDAAKWEREQREDRSLPLS